MLQRLEGRPDTCELYHERFCRITEMHSFPILATWLLLTLGCLLTSTSIPGIVAVVAAAEEAPVPGRLAMLGHRAIAMGSWNLELRGRETFRPVPSRDFPDGFVARGSRCPLSCGRTG